MAYADFEYYMDTYLGTAISTKADFNRLANRASAFLDYYTRGKVKSCGDTEAVKMACCAIAEQYLIVDSAVKRNGSTSGEKQSETVGSYSVSYRSGSELSVAARTEMAKLAQQYLMGTGLLYRGGCRNVCSARCNDL